MLASTKCYAQTNVLFSWNANTQTDLAGYALFMADSEGVYNYDVRVATIDPGQTTYMQRNLPNGTYYWVLRAFDNQNRFSADSNEIMAIVDFESCPEAPTGFMIIRIEGHK